MPGFSILNWLQEHEKRRRPFVFALEWIFVFALAGAVWTGTLSVWQHARPSGAAIVSISTFYASALVYSRLFGVTGCRKCRSPLPLMRREIDRQHVGDREQCVEFEGGGAAWGRHFIQLYRRTVGVDKVRCECRHCHGVWQEVEELATSDYELVRTIELDSDE